MKTIDTPEFHEMLFKYYETFGTRDTNIEQIIEYIDEKLNEKTNRSN